mmetsp:Transcript_25068/g.69152  ORF Transcript_25068/g.69152 Transcript_25068/m.69152 type:complete len:159 (-) Transcript_25068:175-651(-)|eukprot:CAMPEP_0172372432 /NCGR_PEP_ID=MMETSP1060-20121228/47648_1 /TAXON_ID=37318 /ORGANISM="Pseudo-nitzschia pungens, Strain cf. cingulata" /LENGTH=158 /DNA_ID=CAMNT_0013098435 /DNA_START=442 /DNA_END=918 /DNA_ORIENTATION=-
MTPSNHEHGASAARPPQANPLTESSGTTSAVPDAPCFKAEQKTPQDGDARLLPLKRPLAVSTPAASCSLENASASPKEGANHCVIPLLSATREAKKDHKIPIKAKKTLKKKTTKKKKFSSILSGMMQPKTKKENDLAAEREALRQHLGGGTFSKVDKI